MLDKMLIFFLQTIYPRIQLVQEDNSTLLTPTQRTEIQTIVGTLLYYARAVNPLLLPIANEIASQQANPTQKVLTAANRALSYVSSRQNNYMLTNRRGGDCWGWPRLVRVSVSSTNTCPPPKAEAYSASATDATTTTMRWQWAWRGALWVTEEGKVKDGLD